MYEMECNKLDRQKTAIKNLIASMIEGLPLPILTMITCYRGTINTAIDNLTEEQLDKVITEAKNLINAIECENE